MVHRAFTDRNGLQWDVWIVHPTQVERRERQTEAEVANDRRRKAEYRVALGKALSDGWLCFESCNEKRRLAPIPASWDTCCDADLEQLLANATLVRRKLSAENPN